MSTLAREIPPIEELLAKAAPSAHTFLVNTYRKMLADTSVGKTRKQSMEIGGWGATTQRTKEQSGVLQTWTDGAMVRVSTASIYLHLIDLIVSSHPAAGPARKARYPLRSYQKGSRERHRLRTSRQLR
jgi:hypothetical protein